MNEFRLIWEKKKFNSPKEEDSSYIDIARGQDPGEALRVQKMSYKVKGKKDPTHLKRIQ